MAQNASRPRFVQGRPLLQQLEERDLELDQLLRQAREVSASNLGTDPEDEGFPDSHLTLALYRLNTTLTRAVDPDQTCYNISTPRDLWCGF